MNTVEHVPVPSSERSGCGCLKGCGLILLIVCVVSFAGSIGAYVFGRPWLAAQLPALEARQPLLTPLLDYTGLRARLLPPTDAGALAEGRVTGENRRDLLPADLVLYPDVRTETFSIDATQVTAYQRTAAGADAVRTHIVDAMASQEWDLRMERETSVGRLYGWVKGERTCQVEIIPSGTTTEIWLRSNGTP